MLKNGVPVGYGTLTTLFDSSEVVFTVFDTFEIDPYQIGQDNDDAIRSGAWWFYGELGFEPRDPDVRRLAREEMRRLRLVATRRYRDGVSDPGKEARCFTSAWTRPATVPCSGPSWWGWPSCV